MARCLEGKVAIVTGGGAGIGRASAIAFARAGARVAVADIDRVGGDETVDLVSRDGGEAVFVETDVSEARQVESLVAETVKAFGRLDCAHNNAGIIVGGGPTAKATEGEFDQTVAVNLKGVWLCMKHEIPAMLEAGGGAIVNTSSGAGLVGEPGLAIYSATKHGIIGLTRSSAIEYGTSNIRVNAICPGITRTAMARNVAEDRIRARVPMGRLGSPDEVADAVVWLCSDAASFVTGHALSVDGGLVIQ